MTKASVVILAGGRSTRMGFDKQLITSGSSYLIDRIITRLKPFTDEIIIVSNQPKLHENRNCVVVSDQLSEGGALAGIHAGLLASSHPVSLVVGCDMPWVSAAYGSFLMEQYTARSEAEAVTTRISNMLEPLNALYARMLVSRIEDHVAQGQYRISQLLRDSNTVYIAEETARHFSPHWQMFDNINTMKDLEHFRHSEQEEYGSWTANTP